MNLATIISDHDDENVALISRGKELTYGSLCKQIDAFRSGLIEMGLEPGDRVAIASSNNRYFVVSYFAILGAGCVAVPLNPAAPAPQLEKQLTSTQSRLLVVTPTSAAAAGQLNRENLPDLQHIIATAGVEIAGSVPFESFLELPKNITEPHPIQDRNPDDLAVLIFTSGTAGSPRAAMLTHGNLFANIQQIQQIPQTALQDDDVVFGVLPLFHIFGLQVVLAVTLYAGGTVLLIERFDPATAIEAVIKHGVTIILGPPTMWGAWANLPDIPKDAFSTVRLATSGAAKLSVEAAHQLEDKFTLHLHEGYGLTEAAPVVTSSTGVDAPFGSIGVALPGVELRLVDDEGEDVLVGDAGELWVRGPNVFVGYWQDEKATQSALSDDGWLHTGDVGVVNDNGHLFLVDRLKDLIIVSGFNVYPAEVEDVLVEHPAIQETAVVGVAHPYSGEAVKAYVVLCPGTTAEEEDIISWCADHLARYKCPNKVLFVDELPLGLAGKVLRRQLRAVS